MISIEQASKLKQELNNNILLTIHELFDLLVFADDNYYNSSDEPILLSDKEHDSVYTKAKAIDPTNPYFLGVGSSVRGGKVKLPYQMGSLDQVYTGDITKYISDNNLSEHIAVVSHKLDGNSAMVIWDNKGQLQIAYSRGDGHNGSDITRKIIQIPSVPKTINQNGPLVVRGEVIIKIDNFPIVQSILLAEKGKQYKNPRNTVSGIMNSKDTTPTIFPYIEFIAYEIVDSELSKQDQLVVLNSLGFKTVEYSTHLFKELTDDSLTNILLQAKKETEYEIDGLVIDVHSYQKRLEMNPTKDTLNPAYSVKFKVTDESNIVTTTVVDVEINVSKDGYLKPRVNVQPIDVLGVTVQWATGFNMKYIFDNRIQPGTKVKIARNGDVIPTILEVESNLNKSFEEFQEWFTSKIEVFGNSEWTETGVDLVLTDVQSNDTARFEQLVAFFDSLDINNLGEGNIQKMFDVGFDTPEQILMLTLEDICTIVNSKPIGKKIFTGLKEKITNIPLYKLMGAHPALGRGVGVRKMKKLYEAFQGDMTKCTDIDAIVGVEGFDEKTAIKIVNGYPKFQDFLNYVSSIVTIQPYIAPITGNQTGNVFVFTGVRSPKLEQIIEKQGGKVGSSVSAKTTYVITDNVNGTSGKLTKARSLNVPIITLDQLTEMLS